MSFPAPTGRSVTPDHTQKIGQTPAYIDHYHHRPHSGLNYRTPSEVRQTWDDAGEPLQNTAA